MRRQQLVLQPEAGVKTRAVFLAVYVYSLVEVLLILPTKWEVSKQAGIH